MPVDDARGTRHRRIGKAHHVAAMQHAARVAHVRQGRLDHRHAVDFLARIGRSDVARIDAGVGQRLEALGHGLRRRDAARRRGRILAAHDLGARDVAHHARPQRHRLALLGDAAAREGEAAGDLQRLAGRLERHADAARAQELDGDAHRHGEGGVGAAVGGAAGHQAERVVGEGQDRAAMHAAGIVAVARLGRQHAMHRPGLRRIAMDAEIERAGMVLERIGRGEDGVAGEVDGIGHIHALIEELARIAEAPRSETTWQGPSTRSTFPGIGARRARWPLSCSTMRGG